MGKRVLVEVAEEVWRAAKRCAATEGRPVKDLVTAALRQYLAGAELNNRARQRG